MTFERDPIAAVPVRLPAQHRVVHRGEPGVVAFRKAYKAGQLKDLSNGRFEVRLKHEPGVIYQVNAQGRPVTLTVGKQVIHFTTYESLPVSDRKVLDRLTHHCEILEPGNASWRFKSRSQS